MVSRTSYLHSTFEIVHWKPLIVAFQNKPNHQGSKFSTPFEREKNLVKVQYIALRNLHKFVLKCWKTLKNWLPWGSQGGPNDNENIANKKSNYKIDFWMIYWFLKVFFFGCLNVSHCDETNIMLLICTLNL